jgi:hypothetical protein
VAPEPTSSKSSLLSRLLGSAGPAVSKVRSVNPAAAKTSAVRGATGTKDLISMSIAYVKQETKEPLKGIGRLLGAGIAGAALMGLGLVMFGLAFLRGLQSAFGYVHKDGGKGVFTGRLSFVPYILAALLCVLALVLIVLKLSRAKSSVKRNGGTQ